MTASTATNPTEPTSRRDFLKMAWAGLGALVAAEAGVMAVAFSLPRIAEGEFGSLVTAGAVDDFPPNTVTPFNQGRFYLSRLEDGGFLALYRKCTHLGCTVPWEQGQHQFICPCHASAFDAKGDVLNPPAPRALDLFPVIIEDGMVKVDTGTVIQRDKFDASQVAYA
ncbi:MAG: Rieske (2Fe-2S) protein [Anaerolineae bacterium]